MSPSGGMGALIADWSNGTRLELPHVELEISGDISLSGNPLDIGAIALHPDENKLTYLDAIVRSEPSIDAVLLVLTPLVNDFSNVGDLVARFATDWMQAGTATVVTYLASEVRLAEEAEARLRSEAGVAVIAQPEQAVSALAAVAGADKADLPGDAISTRNSDALPADLFTAISERGVRIPEQAAVESLDAALEIADRIGYPVVAKVSAPEIEHRTQLRGVLTGLSNEAELSAAYTDLAQRFEAYLGDSGGRILVQEQCQGQELLIGITHDPEFGPILTVAAGGVTAELMSEAVFVPLPCTDSQVLDAMRELRLFPLFGGYRNMAALDLDATLSSIRALITVYDAEPGIRELEVNPLIVGPDSATAVDVLAA